MECIFDKGSFSLCYVPVPKGYPQSQTHCGVKMWNDNIYMTTSPYPAYKLPQWKLYMSVIIRKLSFNKINLIKRGEDYENPCIYVQNGLDLYPVKFKPCYNNPIENKPEDKYGLGSYCSDPDLFIDNGKVFVLNRKSYRKSTVGTLNERYDTEVYLIEGSLEEDSFKLHSIDKIFDDGDTSPCILKYNDVYVYLSLDTNSYNTGEPCKAVNIRTSSSIRCGWSEKRQVELKRGDYEPWHISLFKYKEELYAIIACIQKGVGHRCWTMLGAFNEEMTELRIYQTPLTDFKSYRSSAIVNMEGEFILYNTTVNEKISGGTSVDGREIIMAHMPFNELLKKLRENE